MSTDKYRLNLEVITDTEEGLHAAVSAVMESLERGETTKDVTFNKGGEWESSYSYSYTLKHGVSDSLLQLVNGYYDHHGRVRQGYLDALHASLDTFKYNGMTVPQHLWDGLIAYITEGRGVGDFLTACLENNLSEAVSHADDMSMAALPAVSAWLYNNAPTLCYGSYRDMQLWHEAHALAQQGWG